jgi:hypothetical protein
MRLQIVIVTAFLISGLFACDCGEVMIGGDAWQDAPGPEDAGLEVGPDDLPEETCTSSTQCAEGRCVGELCIPVAGPGEACETADSCPYLYG